MKRVVLVFLLVSIPNVSWAPPAPGEADIDQLIQDNATSMQELQKAVSNIEALAKHLASTGIDSIIQAKLESYAQQLDGITKRLESKLPTKSAGA